MKRTYNTPKAVHVDFNYEEKVTASSSGSQGVLNGNYLNYCQAQSTGCGLLWTNDTTVCMMNGSEWSLRP